MRNRTFWWENVPYDVRPRKTQISLRIADLILRWAHMSEGTFSDLVAEIVKNRCRKAETHPPITHNRSWREIQKLQTSDKNTSSRVNAPTKSPQLLCHAKQVKRRCQELYIRKFNWDARSWQTLHFNANWIKIGRKISKLSRVKAIKTAFMAPPVLIFSEYFT